MIMLGDMSTDELSQTTAETNDHRERGRRYSSVRGLYRWHCSR
jgi:hypothetical protein